MSAVAAGVAALLAVAAAGPAGEELPDPQPPLEADVDVEEHLGQAVPRDLPFVDSSGRAVRFGDYLKGRPVVVALVYYRCPVLCGLLLGGLSRALKALDWRIGREFDLVTVSMDPGESAALADEKRRGYLQAVGQPDTDTRWAFLTGKVDSIDALSDAIGFRYRYVGLQRQFAHVAALAVLTPDGRVSRYLYGVEFEPKQVKLALFEAADGRVGTSFERVILRCFRYDPSKRKYENFMANYFRAGGLVLLVLVGGLLAGLWRRDLQRMRAR